MADELDVVETDDGRRLYDVPGAPRVVGSVHAPVRLLGAYDNVFLSHADRARIVPEAHRTRWVGTNGGVGSTERREPDEEIDRVTALLAG